MKYYAVIDTNVIVSAMLRWDSVQRKLNSCYIERGCGFDSAYQKFFTCTIEIEFHS